MYTVTITGIVDEWLRPVDKPHSSRVGTKLQVHIRRPIVRPHINDEWIDDPSGTAPPIKVPNTLYRIIHSTRDILVATCHAAAPPGIIKPWSEEHFEFACFNFLDEFQRGIMFAMPAADDKIQYFWAFPGNEHSGHRTQVFTCKCEEDF